MKPKRPKPPRKPAPAALPGALPPSLPPALPTAALALLVFAAYYPALFAGFVWDDKVFLDAPPISTFAGLADIWFTPGSLEFEGHYWPLVYTTFWLEHKLWGFTPFPFHLSNIILHGANSFLLWRLLARLEVPGAWLIAAVFALHPAHVEAVAWIIARKDLLATFFYLLAAHRYLCFRATSSGGIYLAVLVFFTAGMLSKSFVITLPAAMLIWVWWRHGRVVGRDVMQVVPLLALGFAIIVFDMIHYLARADLDFEYSAVERVLIASKALWFYASKLLWPDPLLVIYPLWEVDAVGWRDWLYLPAAIALALALWWARHRWGRGPLAGMLFFAVTLSPMLGLVGDNAFMLFSFVADRYQYLASAGMLAVLIAAAVHLCRRLSPAALRPAQALAALLLLGCGALTFRQAQTFHDEIALFKHVIAHNPHAYHVYFNLGNALMEAKRMEEAAAALRVAAERDPDTVNIHINLGVIGLETKSFEPAERSFRRAIALDPDNFHARQNLAAALRRQRRFEESLAAMHAAAKLTPAPSAQHYFYMASDAVELARPQEAARYYQQALQVDPEYNEARNRLLFLYLEQKDYAAALRLEPTLMDVLSRLAYDQFHAGQVDEALQLYRHQVAIEPENAAAHANLGAALAQSRRYREAMKSFERARALDPQQEGALENMKIVRERLNIGQPR